jgi:hypothetical protein
MPLTAKIPNLQFDIERLQWCLNNIVLKHPPYWAGTGMKTLPNRRYGGWSLTSFTGDMYDGWQGMAGFQKNGTEYDTELAYKSGFRPRWLHSKKTQICIDYLSDVIDTLEEMGFYPRNVRIWCNSPGYVNGKHTDSADNKYGARLHIPVITNEGCYTEWYTNLGDVRVHLPADGGAHMFRTNISHDVFNVGKTDRYHIIAEAYDTKHLVPGYEYYGSIEKIDEIAQRELARFIG